MSSQVSFSSSQLMSSHESSEPRLSLPQIILRQYLDIASFLFCKYFSLYLEKIQNCPFILILFPLLCLNVNFNIINIEPLHTVVLFPPALQSEAESKKVHSVDRGCMGYFLFPPPLVSFLSAIYFTYYWYLNGRNQVVCPGEIPTVWIWLVASLTYSSDSLQSMGSQSLAERLTLSLSGTVSQWLEADLTHLGFPCPSSIIGGRLVVVHLPYKVDEVFSFCLCVRNYS